MPAPEFVASAASLNVMPTRHVQDDVQRRSVAWLKGAAAFAAAGIGIVVAAAAGYGIGCPFLHITGWQCPLCGTTRLANSLLRGDVAAAWAFNQFTFVGGVILLVLTGVAVVGALAPQRFSRGLPRVEQDRLYLILALVATIFTVVRNIV